MAQTFEEASLSEVDARASVLIIEHYSAALRLVLKGGSVIA